MCVHCSADKWLYQPCLLGILVAVLNAAINCYAEPELLTKRVAVWLQSVPSQLQQAASQFGGQYAEPSLVSCIADAAINLKINAVAFKTSSSRLQHDGN